MPNHRIPKPPWVSIRDIGKASVSLLQQSKAFDEQLEELIEERGWSHHRRLLHAYAEKLMYGDGSTSDGLNDAMTASVEQLFSALTGKKVERQLNQPSKKPEASDNNKAVTNSKPDPQLLERNFHDFARRLRRQVSALAEQRKWDQTKQEWANSYVDLLIAGSDPRPEGIPSRITHHIDRRYIQLRATIPLAGQPCPPRLILPCFTRSFRNHLRKEKRGWTDEEATLANLYVESLTHGDSQPPPSLNPDKVEVVRQSFAVSYHLCEADLAHQPIPGASCDWFPEAYEQTRSIAQEVRRQQYKYLRRQRRK